MSEHGHPTIRERVVHPGLLVAAGVCGVIGVLAGTFGAHGLKQRLTADMLANFETGVRYHLIHAAALLVVAVIAAAMPQSALPRVAGWLMTAGIVVFSGSLYLMALTDQRWLGMITPIGGTAFIVAWALLAIAGFRLGRSPR